jgi:hypothetical protein
MSNDDLPTLRRFSKEACRGKFAVAVASPEIIRAYDVSLQREGGPSGLADRVSYVIARDGRIVLVHADLDAWKRGAKLRNRLARLVRRRQRTRSRLARSLAEVPAESAIWKRRAAVAALFAFIWINVDEISWDWPSIIAGFTGSVSLSEILASLPEAAIGLATGKLWGIGFTVMPYMLLGRILWMASQKYLEWNGNQWVPNFSKVDRAAFQ